MRIQEMTMADENAPPAGPDFTKGISPSELVDGKLLGHVGDAEVVLAQTKNGIFAIDAHCSHYHGPLAEGLIVGDTLRCPWHHACFNLRTGEASCAPATFPLSTWKVEQKDGKLFVREKNEAKNPDRKAPASAPKAIVIVGGGAAGFAAAEMLRRRGFAGSITMLSNDSDLPVDRPNVSKDYLAGSAPEDWMPLRDEAFYKDNKIDLRLNTDVTSIDTRKKQVVTAKGEVIGYDRLLLATGAEPVRLDFPGSRQPNVHVLRTFADSRAIIEHAKTAKRAVVIGASFIGLEAAASLRARKIDVHVVAPEDRPMERILGKDMGDFIRALHEENGVNFHLGNTVTAIDGRKVTLKSGDTLEADLVIMGVGVRPRLVLAEQAGLALDRGVVVNEYLQTSVSEIYAAGDIARWPDPHSGENIRVEHWVVAERQGQTAALNMMGEPTKFDAVPFFWSQHYDVPINYVGHAEKWDDIQIEGDIKKKDCLLRFRRGSKTLAVVTIYRDLDSLKATVEMDRATAAA
jgi:NADPH-dependent 2,4-dienoyl-CoA reductase/sulfur reductase-like enzyme/nitrite reductase/ring-hydroxylating ferredoxin subunit